MAEGSSLLYVNGQFLSSEEAGLSPLDRGFTLADGLFETMVAREDRIFRLEDHLSRLQEGASVLEILLPPLGELARIVRETLQRNRLPLSVVRLTVTRGIDPGRGLAVLTKSIPTVVVRVTPREQLSGNGLGRRLIVSSIRRDQFSPLSRVKSLAYVTGVLARLEASRAKADDALLLNMQGNIACATSSNLFLVRPNGTIVTPPLSDGILAGVARRTVLEVALSLGLRALEESLPAAELIHAQELFLTNVATGPVSVATVDGRPVGNEEPGDVTRALAMAYARMVESW